MKRIAIILSLILILASPVLGAREAETTLLTVVEEQQDRGGTATISLRIEEGQGDVYIDSFPLTRVDTQISVRFAKQMACDYTNINCDSLDFYYKIRSGSSLIGGPSAGATMTALTVALLENKTLNDNTVMTGTITSGGFIGPVGGIPGKVDAAVEKGYERILIPRYGVVEERGQSNIYGDQYERDDIDIQPVSTLDEVLSLTTDMEMPGEPEDISVPQEYQDTMQTVATDLCQRTDNMIQQVDTVTEDTRETRERATSALLNESFYSAASFCFSANIGLRETLIEQQTNVNEDVLRSTVVEDAEEFLEEVDQKPIKTMSDLEASIIVKERLYEVLEEASNEDVSTGYLVERLNSAEAWSEFFNYESQPIQLDEEYLQDACLTKVAEAEERVNYVEFLLPFIDFLEPELRLAQEVSETEDYTYCLFKGAKVKAEANAVLSSTQVGESRRQEFVRDKLTNIERQISQQRSLPIIGYSYYDYASTLGNDVSALTFAEYSAEFSALDMYFPSQDTREISIEGSRVIRETEQLDTNLVYIGIGAGVIIGFIAGIAVILRRDKK